MTVALWMSVVLHGFAVAVALFVRFSRGVRGINLPIILFMVSTFCRRVVAIDHAPSAEETACWNLTHSGLLVLWATTALRATSSRNEDAYHEGYMDAMQDRTNKALAGKEDA